MRPVRFISRRPLLLGMLAVLLAFAVVSVVLPLLGGGGHGIFPVP